MDVSPTILNQSQDAPRDKVGSLWVDLALLLLIIAIFTGLFEFGQEWLAPLMPINGPGLRLDLSLKALPGYALMSFTRGVLALFISFIFSLIMGGLAAHSRRAERLIIPLLDILQSIPVLGFLPGIVITMVRLFPNNNIGLEVSCILMIFTAQTWNLAFAFYVSVRSVPTDFRDVAKLHGFSWWQTFKKIELPSSAIPLVWNSMMSMAGGWFFLTINEAFTLGNRDYRVPGVGSYMSLAMEQGNTSAVIASIVAMALMIILSDRLIWNPLSIWSQKFRLDESTKGNASSTVINFLRRSLALQKLRYALKKNSNESPLKIKFNVSKSISTVTLRNKSRSLHGIFSIVFKTLSLISSIALIILISWASIRIALLTTSVRWDEWLEVLKSLGLTLLRTTSCLILSTLWALPAGIIIGRNSKLAEKVGPFVQLLASFPAPMLYPFIISALVGLNIEFEWGCTALMIFGAQWYILFNSIAGAQSIPADLQEIGEVYKVARLRRWTKIYIPAVFPNLLTGLVTAAGGAWNASIVSEIVRYEGRTLSARGLGSLITTSTESGNIPLLCASIGVMAIALIGINRLVWRPLIKLADQRYSMNR